MSRVEEDVVVDEGSLVWLPVVTSALYCVWHSKNFCQVTKKPLQWLDLEHKSQQEGDALDQGHG